MRTATVATAPRIDDKTPLLEKLLVATDGSPSGRAAVSYAIAVAQRFGSTLTICNAIDRAGAIAECSNSATFVDFTPLLEALDDEANAIVAAAVALATAAGVAATGAVLHGAATHAIVTRAADAEIDAVILGSAGTSGVKRFFLGSTADGVLRRSACPVIVVRPDMDECPPTFARVLVAIDDSEPSEVAADFGFRLMQANRSVLIVCAVADTRSLMGAASTYGYDPTPISSELLDSAVAIVSRQTSRAKRDGITTESIVASGDPVDKIVLAARKHGAGAIVIGTHGRNGVRRLVLGSVAEGVVRRSSVPVIVIPRPERHG